MLLRCLSPGDTVFDIGANIGTHAVPFAKAVAPAGRVYAFEPQRMTFQFLCANAALNNLDNLVGLNRAVGDRAGHVAVPVLDPAVPQNFGALRLGDSGGGETVPVDTIDGMAPQACRLIKIDVEGMEGAVLDGASQTIARHRPIIFVENNTVDGSPAILGKIAALDYRAWWVISNYFNPHNHFATTENIFSGIEPSADLFCLPAEMPADIAGLEPVQGPRDNWKDAAQRIVARQAGTG